MKRIILYSMLTFLFIFFFACKKGRVQTKKTTATKEIPKRGFVLGQEIDTTQLKKELLPQGYNYEPNNRRDPFISLIGKGYKRTQEEVIDLSNLKLVGIMKGPRGAVALFESPDGRSYSVRQGDAVRNGYVKDITDKEVIVEVTAYGVPITVKYELKREKLK